MIFSPACRANSQTCSFSLVSRSIIILPMKLRLPRIAAFRQICYLKMRRKLLVEEQPFHRIESKHRINLRDIILATVYVLPSHAFEKSEIPQGTAPSSRIGNNTLNVFCKFAPEPTSIVQIFV